MEDLQAQTRAELEAEIVRLRNELSDIRNDAKQPLKSLSSNRDARQRAIFESAIDFAIVATDLEGMVSDWNPGAERVMGWSADEMRGRSAERFFTPEDRADGQLQNEMRRSLVDGQATDERWHLRKDGQVFWASGEMMPLRDDEGGHIGYVKILRDRTAGHVAGVALEAAQERLRAILNTVEAAFAIVEVKFDADDKAVDYRFVEANPAFERQAGVDLQGRWVTEFAPDLEQFWFETYGRVAKTRVAENFESYAEAFGRWFDVRAVPVGEASERQIAILFNDVTARRVAEERLRSSEALATENVQRVQLALAAGAIIGTWNWDLTTDRFTVDEAFAQSFGLDPALGRDGIPLAQIVATVHPDDQASLAEAIESVVKRGGSYAHQYRVRRTDGRYYWIEANGRVEHAEDGTPTSFPGVLLDVEERRAMEADRDRAAAALRALNDTLEQRVIERTAELMKAEELLRQSQKMEAVGQLTGGLAHDFNNLLAGISGSLEMIQKRVEQKRFDELGRYMSGAQGAAKRAAALTHRLLAFSRRQTLEPRATDPNGLIAGMEDLIRRTVGPQVAVETFCEPDVWPTLVDPNQLENALLNLCINSRDAMPDGGKIVIEARNKTLDRHFAAERDLPPGEYVSLSVSDNGVGMLPEIVERVFEPFFTTKPIGVGTGLGLSMIFGFAKQSDGQVRVHSEIGKGTSVTILLPRHSALDVGADAGTFNTPGPTAEIRKSVLVVDDEPLVRMLIVDVLEDLGCTVLEAGDGPQAMAIIRSEANIDLLVTDVGLPNGMNGRQVADAARELRRGLKVLFVTGYAENAILSHGHLGPDMEVLTKPFQMEAVTERIRSLIDG
jgi:PAS domain S-box-containing protein